MPRPAPTTLSDAELVDGLGRSGSDCLGVLYDRHGSLVYSIALRVLRSSELAEDVTQDVFVSVWQQSTRFDDDRGDVGAWIARIAHNKAIDTLRSTRSAHDRDVTEEAPHVHDPYDDVDEKLDVDRLLGALSADHREVVELTYFEGRTAVEIAARIGVPVGTVKSRLFHAMRTLREVLLSQDRVRV